MIPEINCKLCKRLYDYRLEVQQRYPQYHCRPVLSFGKASAKLLIVGLAPGLHGANATGIPFTGDASGDLLFKTLVKFGFAEQDDESQTHRLINCRITNAVKCLPPLNKPTGAEVNACNRYLAAELKELDNEGVVLALGKTAHDAVLKCGNNVLSQFKFGHNKIHYPDDRFVLVNSYHCSRYNIQTRRLTTEKFESVFSNIRQRFLPSTK